MKKYSTLIIIIPTSSSIAFSNKDKAYITIMMRWTMPWLWWRMVQVPQPFYFSEEFGPLFLPNPTTAKHIEELLTTKNNRIHQHSLDARKQINQKGKLGLLLHIPAVTKQQLYCIENNCLLPRITWSINTVSMLEYKQTHREWERGKKFEFPLNIPAVTKRRLYCMRLWARPVGFFFLSCLATLGVWPRTFPARAKDPCTLPASSQSPSPLSSSHTVNPCKFQYTPKLP